MSYWRSKGVLGHKLGFAVEKVGSGDEHHARVSELSDLEESLFESRDQVVERLDKWLEKEHGV